MSAANALLKPEECVMLLVDFQAGLGFAVESIPRRLVLNNADSRTRAAHRPRKRVGRVEFLMPEPFSRGFR